MRLNRNTKLYRLCNVFRCFAATSGVCLKVKLNPDRIRSASGGAGFSKETTFAKKPMPGARLLRRAVPRGLFTQFNTRKLHARVVKVDAAHKLRAAG